MLDKFLKTKFSKFMFFICLIITIIFSSILFITLDYLNNKNISSPEYVINNYISMIENKKYYDALNLIVKGDVGFNNYDNFKEYILSKYGDNIKEITFKRVNGSDENRFYFDIYVNGVVKDNISIYLSSEKGKYNIKKSYIDLPSDMYINDVYICVPEGSSVHLNGYFLEESYISNNNEDLALFDSYFEGKKLKGIVLYKISKLLSVPNITVKDNKGNILNHIYDKDKNIYIAGKYQAVDDIEVQNEFIKNVIYKYINFNISGKDTQNLIDDTFKDGILYKTIKKSVSNNVSLYPFEVLSVQSSNIIKLSDNDIFADSSAECNMSFGKDFQKKFYKFRIYIFVKDNDIKVYDIKNIPN